MPVCNRCHLYLRGPEDGEPTQVVAPVLDVVDRLVDLAELSITSQSARTRLGRFRRLCASIALDH
ncbi:MAG: hypothetical protein ACR2FG_15265 [Marmoricola sp.]